ncbi:hypothetical protein [Cupriavidus taiwanensis]|uniref:hypothetical protein n=1 Tax=Cupriavidus taiwanensis TaxID=164546 RepID=UPI000E197739|nr:hypothetical protein [Cupriavidus taiwanensis]SOY44437.1 conserved exported hypothetical protein [Cupriavidus taiwanensis]
MNMKSLMAATIALVMLGASGWSTAASATPTAEGAKSSPQDKGHDMMKDHVMGGGMVGSCPMMAQLPPGNEKLSMQMHAEMMQAMGEIMHKYADTIQTPPMK